MNHPRWQDYCSLYLSSSRSALLLLVFLRQLYVTVSGNSSKWHWYTVYTLFYTQCSTHSVHSVLHTVYTVNTVFYTQCTQCTTHTGQCAAPLQLAAVHHGSYTCITCTTAVLSMATRSHLAPNLHHVSVQVRDGVLKAYKGVHLPPPQHTTQYTKGTAEDE